MAKILWAPDVLKAAGLDVYEMPGWEQEETRPGFEPEGVVCHHTATGPNWLDGHVALLLKRGRSDLTGPLSQFGLERDGTWVCIAAGRCNHNGFGQWGNDSIGIEAYNNGKGEPWPKTQTSSYITGVAAICKYMKWGISQVRGHKETDPDRKIDPTFNMDAFRVGVSAQLTPTSKPTESSNGKGGKMFLATQKSTGNMWFMEETRRTLVPTADRTNATRSDIPNLGTVSDDFFKDLVVDRKPYQ